MAVPTVSASATSSSSSSGSTSTFTVTLPTLSADDILLVLIQDSGTRAGTASGWSVISPLAVNCGSATGTLTAIWKVATGSEGASVGVNMGNTYWDAIAIAVAITGASATAITDATPAATGAQTGASSISCPAVTASANDSLILRLAGCNNGATLTVPSSPASTSVNTVYKAGSSDRLTLAKENSGISAGSSGTANFASGATWNGHFGATLALAPDAAVAPTISSVTLTGTSQIGNTLTATVVTDQDPVDSIAYTWQTASDGSGTGAADISGETASTLALTYADFGSLLDTAAYVRCQAIATKNSLASDEVASAWQAVTVASGGGSGPASLIDNPLVQ